MLILLIVNDAEAFSYSKAQSERVGYYKEFDAAIYALYEMHRRGIVILIGEDYSFA